MLAAAAVHTTGINWESAAVIVGSVVAVISLILAVQGRRNAAIRTEITDAVNNLSTILLARLETKETVQGLAVRLARLEAFREAFQARLQAPYREGRPGPPDGAGGGPV